MIRPPRKLPVLKPKLSRVRRMTIALGILAGGGAVIAADRQETAGNFKSSMGKLSGTWVSNRGTLFVSGAGEAAYIDSLTDEILEWFKKNHNSLNAREVEDELRRHHKKFYREHVLPMSQWAQNDLPDYELLVAYSGVSHATFLWTTRKLAVTKQSEFAAVGIGATAAKAMLQRLGYPFIELEIAVSLAVYIVYQVKRTIDLVGLDTDIIEIRNGVPLLVSRDEINEMEAQFRDYEDVERDSLYYYLGGDLNERENMSGTVGHHSQKEKSLRAFFVAWNERRRQQFTRQPQSSATEETTTPSTSQTPEREQ